MERLHGRGAHAVAEGHVAPAAAPGLSRRRRRLCVRRRGARARVDHADLPHDVEQRACELRARGNGSAAGPLRDRMREGIGTGPPRDLGEDGQRVLVGRLPLVLCARRLDLQDSHNGRARVLARRGGGDDWGTHQPADAPRRRDQRGLAGALLAPRGAAGRIRRTVTRAPESFRAPPARPRCPPRPPRPPRPPGAGGAYC